MAKRLRVATYARASTRDQKVRGNSIKDQTVRLEAWAERMGHELVEQFSEIVSGKANMRTDYFEAMMESLPHLQVDALAVVNLDRYSRNKYDASYTTTTLSRAGIKLFELTHSETNPFDLSVNEDRDYLEDKFRGAESEHRSITRRNIERARAERERGAVTHNRAPFGLKIVNSNSAVDRSLAVDDDKIAFVREAEDAVLRGESLPSIVERFRDVPGFWKSAPGLRNAMIDKAGGYLRAGARTPERHAAIAAQWVTRRATSLEGSRPRRKYDHDLSGLVGCKLCHDAGEPAIGMYGWMARDVPMLCCIGVKGKGRGVVGQQRQIHRPVYIPAAKLLAAIMERLEIVAVNGDVAQRVLDLMERARPTGDTNEKQRHLLERTLRAFDDEEARLEKRLAFAFDLAAEGGDGATEARRHIQNAETERFAIEAKRAATRSKLAALPVLRVEPTPVETLMFEMSQWPDFRIGKDGVVIGTIREPLVRWVKAVGLPLAGRPVPHSPAFELTWPFVDDAVRETRSTAKRQRVLSR